jgi:hypothetical protein
VAGGVRDLRRRARDGSGALINAARRIVDRDLVPAAGKTPINVWALRSSRPRLSATEARLARNLAEADARKDEVSYFAMIRSDDTFFT